MKKTISISRSIRMVPLLFVILFAAATLVESELCPNATNISPCVCHGNPNITHVVCSNITSEDHLNNILRGGQFLETLPHLVLQNLPFSTLPYLGRNDLRVKDLEILDGNIFNFSKDAFRSQSLLSLRVERNRLEDVPTEALDVVWSQLKVLSMSGNVLKKLGHRSLSDMRAVEKLTLSENEISEVDTISLPANVQYLWISRNNLTTFNRSLHHTKYLKHLDASNNRLTSMKGEFDGLFSLQTVILDHNNISDISGTFSNLTNSLRELSLVGNGILEVGEALADLRNLTHLNLSRNAITNLSPTVFENVIDLYDLNLSENPLMASPICPTLKSLMSLRIVNFSNSNLKDLLSTCFENNTNLGFVDLSRNQLSSLQLYSVKNLVKLDISFNNFKQVYLLALPWKGKGTTLILEDNPWQCSMITTWLLNELSTRGYDFPGGQKPQICVVNE